jgi:hypothetical protein
MARRLRCHAPEVAARAADDPAVLRRRLRVTVGLLAAIVVGIALAGRSYETWPVSAWPVYSRVRAVVPGPTTAALEVRAVTAGGTTHRLRSDELVEFSRVGIARGAIAASVDDADVRPYLAHLVERAVDGELDRVEVWEVTWAVDAGAVPPLDRADPVRERRLAAFRPDGTDLDRTGADGTGGGG